MLSYDIDDTFGLWSYGFTLPLISIMNHKSRNGNTDKVCRIYKRYWLINFLTKFTYSASLALILGSSYLLAHPFGFDLSCFPLQILTSLLVLIFSIPTLSVVLSLLSHFVGKYYLPSLVISTLISCFVMNFGIHGVAHFCNYSSMFLNFQFITVIPFSLYYFALTSLEEK